MNQRTARKLALVLFLGAAASWGWIVARGGLVEHPPQKPDRGARSSSGAAARASVARRSARPVAPDHDDVDAAVRVALLEQRIASLELARARPERAGIAELDARFAATANATTGPGPIGPISPGGSGTAGARTPGADEVDGELAAFLAAHPLEGTHVRGALRIASFGGRVLREGDELVPRVIIERVEPGGVLLDGGGRRVHLSFGARAAGSEAPR